MAFLILMFQNKSSVIAKMAASKYAEIVYHDNSRKIKV